MLYSYVHHPPQLFHALCFDAPKQLSPPLPPAALEGITVVLGPAGLSCDAVCAQQSGACSQRHLATLNSCDRLREHSNCEAGCVEEAHTAAMPAYITSRAPKPQRPALCLVSWGPTAGLLSCGASEQHAQRLCACDAAVAGGPQAAVQQQKPMPTELPAVAGGPQAAVQQQKPTELPAAAEAPQGAKAAEPLSGMAPQ